MTDAPELPAQLWAQLWGEALQRHPDASVPPGPTSIEVACLAYAAGWEARGVVKDSSVVGVPPGETGQLTLGVTDLFPPGDDEIRAWADSCDCVPPETLIDEDDEDGYGFIFRPAQFYATVRAALARWGRPVPPPAEGEVGELVELVGVAAGACEHEGYHAEAQACRHAADLLQQRAGELERLRLVPVPVSERSPEAEEMTEDDEVWIEDPGHEYPLADRGDYDWDPHKWVLRPISKFDAKNGRRWIPAPALPLPSGEATNG